MSPQRKARVFTIVGLTEMRTARRLSMARLAKLFVPPVHYTFISQLEAGHAKASPATLFDLARIVGSIELEDEYGQRYTLVYRGCVPQPLEDDIAWP